MAKAKKRSAEAGMTLLEVVLAVAIFAAVIGVTAQSLLSFYVSMDLQEQRIEALQSCRAVLGAIREQRDKTANDFPTGLISWVDDQTDLGWSDYVSASTHEELREHSLQVFVENMEGQPPVANDSPIQVTVRSSWLDRRNRPIHVDMVTVLNNR